MFRVIQVHKTTIRKWFEIMSYETAFFYNFHRFLEQEFASLSLNEKYQSSHWS